MLRGSSGLLFPTDEKPMHGGPPMIPSTFTRIGAGPSQGIALDPLSSARQNNSKGKEVGLTITVRDVPVNF